jgi:two-component system chemotaxis response regulator CheY
MIIDQTGIITRVMTTMLTELGWGPVETVVTPIDALTALREKRFGLVMTDWAMEPMDGGEFIKSLRADVALASTPVMIVTGNPDPAQFIIASDAGVDAYALVPFDVETLAMKLDQIRLRRARSPHQMGD